MRLLGRLLLTLLVRALASIGYAVLPRPAPEADLIALSWLTRVYARYGSDEQMADVYDLWHRRADW